MTDPHLLLLYIFLINGTYYRNNMVYPPRVHGKGVVRGSVLCHFTRVDLLAAEIFRMAIVMYSPTIWHNKRPVSLSLTRSTGTPSTLSF